MLQVRPSSEKIAAPNWGSLNENWTNDGLGKRLIKKRKSEFLKRAMDLNRPIDPWMKDLYLKTIPTNRVEKIEEIEESLYEDLSHLFQKAWSHTLVPKELSDYETNLESKLDEVSRLGIPETTYWHVYHTADFKNDESWNRFAMDLIKNTWARCLKGDPSSFERMAMLLNKSEVAGTNLGWETPLNDVSLSIKVLGRLSDLGVQHAQYALSSVYQWNKTGRFLLKLSTEQRLKGLQDLALKGHAYSQREFGHTLHSLWLGIDRNLDVSREYREKGFKELIKNEVGFNPSVTGYYLINGSHNLNAKMPLPERIKILEKRAKDGDKKALEGLIRGYQYNHFWYLGVEDPLKLSDKQRWKKLLKLQKINKAFWNECMADAYLKGFCGSEEDPLKIPISEEDRHKWILDNAFKDFSTEEAACKLLSNRLRGRAKLLELALEGSDKATISFVIGYRHNRGKYGASIETLKKLTMEGSSFAGRKLIKRLFPDPKNQKPIKSTVSNEDLRDIAWDGDKYFTIMIIKKMQTGQHRKVLERIVALRESLGWINAARSKGFIF